MMQKNTQVYTMLLLQQSGMCIELKEPRCTVTRRRYIHKDRDECRLLIAGFSVYRSTYLNN